MSPLTISRPAPDEADGFYHGYISKVSGENIAEQLGDQLHEVESLFGPLPEAVAMYRYAPGKWSVKEILGHLADVERVLAYRLLRISRGDPTPLASFDENTYVPAGRFDEYSIATLLQAFHRARQNSLSLVETTPADCWSNWGTANEQPVTARALAYILLGHVTHHLGVLRERYQVGRPGVAAEASASRATR